MTLRGLSAIIRVKIDKRKQKMKNLRIFFTIVCAVCLAILPIVAIVWLNFAWIPLIVAGISFVLMLHFKNKQLLAELSNEKPAGDFFAPAPQSATEPLSDTESQPDTEPTTQTNPDTPLESETPTTPEA